jgi:ribonuclease E
MLIDATHPEETRVVVLNGNRLEEFDFETSTKKQIKGNIYLAKITRVEPSLQAAFVEYGGNRHGFLAFSEIHPDYYRIPVSDREAILAEERAAQYEEERAAEYAEEHGAGPGHDDDRHDDDRHYDAGHENGGHDDENGHDSAEPGNAAFDGDEPRSGGEVEPPTAAAPDEDVTAKDLPPAIAAQQAGEGLNVTTLYGPPGDETAAYGPPGDETAAHEAETAQEAALSQAEPVEFAAAGETVEGTSAVTSVVDVADEAVPVETVGGDDEFEEAQARPRVRHYRNYKIQEVIKRRQIILIQVTKEERGNKGAALTTYLSLAGRYCVLMPNAGRGGGVSRKITSAADRRRLKELMEELDVPEGMGIIVRTAGSERSKAEIKRDYEYLLRLWDDIRELTLRSSAPALIYEEGNLIKRAIRDLYSRDMEEILVEGEEGYRTAKDFMRMLMPSHASRVKAYRDPAIPLLHRFQVDSQIDQIHNPVVQLRSGGYIVINPTEALVSIDVNSGRATKERNIEETATKTNLEAAEEIARQLRLRDLAGLVVIDFIDMEEMRNQKAVEARLKDAMKTDRARIQLGRISAFGLLELSRQRLRSSLIEASTQTCPHCNGTGTIRSTESTALVVLRALEEEGIRRRSAEVAIYVPTQIALYVLNQKRDALGQIEQRYGFRVAVAQDDTLVPPAFRLERVRALTPQELSALPVPTMATFPEEEEHDDDDGEYADDDVGATETAAGEPVTGDAAERNGDSDSRRKRRRRKRRRGGEEHLPPDARDAEETAALDHADTGEAADGGAIDDEATDGEAAEGEEPGDDGDEETEVPSAEGGADGDGVAERKRRRRGKRGGRRRRREDEVPQDAPAGEQPAPAFDSYAEEEYPSVFDYARDGREHLFEAVEPTATATEPDQVPPVDAPAEAVTEETASVETVSVEIVSVSAEPSGAEPPAAEVPPAAAAAAAEDEPAAKPKRRRTTRKKVPDAEAEAEAPVAVAVEAGPAETAEAPPPKRRRTRKAAPAPEAAAETPVEAIVPPVEETVHMPEPQAPLETEPETASTAETERAAAIDQPAVTIELAPAVDTPAPAEPEPVAAEPPAQSEPDNRPRKTGWWRRLVQ